MKGFDLSRECNFWQILAVNGTLTSDDKALSSDINIYNIGICPDAVDVDVPVAYHADIIIKAIIASGHPCDRK